MAVEDCLFKLFEAPSIGGKRLQQCRGIAASHCRSQRWIAATNPRCIRETTGRQLTRKIAHAWVSLLPEHAQQCCAHHHGQMGDQGNGLVMNERIRTDPVRTERASQSSHLRQSFGICLSLWSSNPGASSEQTTATGVHP